MNSQQSSLKNHSKPVPSFDFTKQHRLLDVADYKAVFDAPIKKIHTTHLLAFVAKGTADTPRLGLAITKKKLKRAVWRNRIKRLIREAFRHHRQHLDIIDMVVIVKSSYDKDFDIAQEVDELFNKIQQKYGI